MGVIIGTSFALYAIYAACAVFFTTSTVSVIYNTVELTKLQDNQFVMRSQRVAHFDKTTPKPFICEYYSGEPRIYGNMASGNTQSADDLRSGTKGDISFVNRQPNAQGTRKRGRFNKLTTARQIPAEYIKFGLQNVRSVKNKGNIITKLVKEYGINILAMTETWLYDENVYGGENKNYIDQFRGNGYSFVHSPRANCRGRGGGVGLIFPDRYKCEMINHNFKSFEISDSLLTCTKTEMSLRVVVIYRPPNENMADFLKKFKELLHNITKSNGRYLPIIMGDFNLPFNDRKNPAVTNILRIIEQYRYTHLVTQAATHARGNTLDNVLVPKDKKGQIQYLNVHNRVSTFDHNLITFSIQQW